MEQFTQHHNVTNTPEDRGEHLKTRTHEVFMCTHCAYLVPQKRV